MTDKIDDGGPAFPALWQPELRHPVTEDIVQHAGYAEGGMSLRDWFAGQALADAIRDYDRLTRTSEGSGLEWVLPYASKATGSREDIIARQAYRYADAMIRARKGGGP